MPGDGIGEELIDVARMVLERLDLDADCIPADIGWKFWCTEGNPLPKRTIDIMKTCNCALFGAVTSKSKEDANKELALDLQGKGLIYCSPIVTLRQMFDLYTNFRPCKAYPGNQHNYRDNIDLVIFRENTEG
jgi:isocitrate/isopropylmalate dehydrogenase